MSVSNTIVYFNGDLETHRDVATFLWSAWTFLDPATGQSIVQIGNDPKTFKSLCVLDDLFDATFEKSFELKKGKHEWHLNENDRGLLNQYVEGRRAKAPGMLIRQVRKVVDFFQPLDQGGSLREFETAEDYGKFMAAQDAPAKPQLAIVDVPAEPGEDQE